MIGTHECHEVSTTVHGRWSANDQKRRVQGFVRIIAREEDEGNVSVQVTGGSLVPKAERWGEPECPDYW
jgi:hypothetical protein